MNSPVKDPRSLTKDRLKSELSNHNISLPPSDSRKDVYVDLYRQHILAPATASASAGSKYAEVGNRARLEALSSDEEDFDRPVTHKKNKMTNGETDPITADEVDGLTDDELYMALARRGETVGPILDSTRRVYQKKLKRLLTNETEATSEYTNGHHEEPEHEDEFSDQDYDEEPMETEVIPIAPYKEPEPPRQRQRQPERSAPGPSRSAASRSEEVVRPTTILREQRLPPPPSDDKPIITHRSTYKSTKNVTNDTKDHGENEIVTQVNEQVSEQTLASINTQRQQLKQGQGISVRLQVFVIAVCALVVFLVLSNMEPAYDSPPVIGSETPV